jgi:hypothetical protein
MNHNVIVPMPEITEAVLANHYSTKLLLYYYYYLAYHIIVTMYICSPSLYFTVIKLMEEAVLM